MIEIIQRKEEQEKKSSENRALPKEVLPKNFRQIGMPEGDTRIYIEDYVYTYLHPSFAGGQERRICILVGEIKQIADYRCIYVQGAVELQGVTYCGNAPILSEATRVEICMQVKKYFEGSMLLGWFYDEKGIPPKLTPEIERVHKNFFGGSYRILLLSDSLEKDETLYIYEESAIRKKDGYYIYYERNIRMQEYMIDSRRDAKQEIKPEEVRDTALQNYREMLLNKRPPKVSPWNSLVYGTGILLVIAICVIGISMLNNYQKMKSIEAAVNVMGRVAEDSEAREDSEDVPRVVIENAESKVEPETEFVTVSAGVQPQAGGAMPPDSAQNGGSEEVPPDTQGTSSPPEGEKPPADTQNTQAEPLSEAQQIRLQGYYIVQKGDSMSSICQKIYRDIGKIDAVCAANGIDDIDAIYAGQKLVLP